MFLRTFKNKVHTDSCIPIKMLQPYKGNISVQREGVSVQEILDIVLKGHNLTYLIEDKIIFIKKQSQTTVTKIRGRVTDTKSEPLAGVTILIEGTCIGTTTDSNGNYVFTIPDIDKINIIYSFMGMARLQSYLYRPEKNINVIFVSNQQRPWMK